MSDLRTIDAVVVLASVAGETIACAERGDLPTANTRQGFYILAANAAKAAGGRVVKAIGSGVLLTFPVTSTRDVIAAIRQLQQDGSRLWQKFDARCRVQIKIAAGSVVAGPMGPPDDLRWDICGDTVNRLFKLPASDFVMTPEVEALLH